MVDEFAAQILVRTRCTKEHAVGDNARTASAGIEQPQKERDKEKLSLRGLDFCRETARNVLLVERALEWRIGEDERIFVRVRIIL